MAFAANDLQGLMRALEEQPQARAQLRMLLLTNDVQALPEQLERLTGIVEQLAQAQQRTEERLERLEAIVQVLAEAQERTERRLERLEATVQALAEAQERTEQRLDKLAQAQERTERRLEQLAQAQERTERRLEQLAQAQERTERRLEQLAQAQQRTEESLDRLSEEMQAFATWQRGEAGRRKGERYEQLIGRRAPALFNGGQGGPTDQPRVQERLLEALRKTPALDTLTDDENPFLADLIWWKDEQFMIVEASLKVNGNDVSRAARRAEALQRAGVSATGIVIGEAWTGPDARQQAAARSIQWKVGDDLSDGLLDFRRL
ncbi:MAG: Chromosome partition protein Smc [Anaerolineales bacterium]|nr:Chromosome partition protein Smc [Anaerolineales bacterium]